MGYELNFVEGECITLSHIGNVYLVEHQQALDEAAKVAEETQCGNILLDLRQQKGSLSLLEEYVLEARVPVAFKTAPRLAVLVSGYPASRIQFLENAAQTHNIALRYFDDFEDAVRWLFGGGKDSERPDTTRDVSLDGI